MEFGNSGYQQTVNIFTEQQGAIDSRMIIEFLEDGDFLLENTTTGFQIRLVNCEKGVTLTSEYKSTEFVSSVKRSGSPLIFHSNMTLYTSSGKKENVFVSNLKCKVTFSKADIISQMIENCLISGKESANGFSIGELSLDRISPYNSRQNYGWMMNFSVQNFR